MIHALTIDVEDYHSVFSRDRLGRDMSPTRAVVDNMHRLLGWMAERRVRCTCFVLGEVAQAFPDLVREIAEAGHELGVHGFYHRQVFKLTPELFRREVADAKGLIEGITGLPVKGHRAPAFSIMPRTAWALDVLADEGFEYDSSIFPVATRRYGWPGFRPEIHSVQLTSGRTLIEAPLSTVCILGHRIPVGGGGYLRHFPGWMAHFALRRVARVRPAIVYLHPYEFETKCPEPDTSCLQGQALRRVTQFHRLQRRNRETMEGKFKSLLDRFDFAPLSEVVEAVTRKTAMLSVAVPE